MSIFETTPVESVMMFDNSCLLLKIYDKYVRIGFFGFLPCNFQAVSGGNVSCIHNLNGLLFLHVSFVQ